MRYWRTSVSVPCFAHRRNPWPRRPAGREQGQPSFRPAPFPASRYLWTPRSDDSQAERREAGCQAARLQKLHAKTIKLTATAASSEDVQTLFPTGFIRFSSHVDERLRTFGACATKTICFNNRLLIAP